MMENICWVSCGLGVDVCPLCPDAITIPKWGVQKEVKNESNIDLLAQTPMNSGITTGWAVG